MVRGRHYNHTTDCWSLGVILYYLLAKRFPFEAPDSDESQSLEDSSSSQTHFKGLEDQITKGEIDFATLKS